MFKIQSGILDKTRLVSNILLVILVAGNLFFSIQYMENLKAQAEVKEQGVSNSIQVSRFLKLFVDVVLNNEAGKTISYDDRLKLENDVRQIKDVDLTKQWDAFVASKDAKAGQENAVKLMKMLTNKLILN
ncbi:MAG: hypothetical protein WC229_02805 [Candidatus Paceibacterota bacterium]|jgi:hypothetical protein